MMYRNREDVAAIVTRCDERADRHVRIEGDRTLHPVLHRVPVGTVIGPVQVQMVGGQPPAHGVCGFHDLDKTVFPGLHQPGPQRLVAADDHFEGSFPGRLVEMPLHVPLHRHDVPAARFREAFDGPERLLARGSRYVRRTVHGHEPRQCRSITGATRRIHRPGQAGDGGVIEHRAQRQSPVASRVEQRDQSGRQQRVPAQDEEVVLGRQLDFPEPEDVGHQPGNGVFGFRRQWTATSTACPQIDCRQRTSIKLPVHGHRQLIEPDKRRGHHVGGQSRRCPLAQFVVEPVGHRRGSVVVGRPGAGFCVVGGEYRPRHRVFDRHHGRGRDAWVRAEYRSHLTGFHTLAPDLHLVVGTARVLQDAGGGPPDEIACPIDPLARAGGVGDKPGGRQTGLPTIAASHLDTRHVQLTDDTDGCRP